MPIPQALVTRFFQLIVSRQFTESERELDLQVAELVAEVKRLNRIEQAARAVVNSFTNSIDYNAWDKALDTLETALKEKS